jgi:hypothetical protein
MYILFTRQRGGDTNVPTEAPRFIDTDPKKVLDVARLILSAPDDSADGRWIREVIVYDLEVGRLFSIWNASSLPHVNKENVHTVAYIGYWVEGKPLQERAFGDFAEKCGLPATPRHED